MVNRNIITKRVCHVEIFYEIELKASKAIAIYMSILMGFCSYTIHSQCSVKAIPERRTTIKEIIRKIG